MPIQTLMSPSIDGALAETHRLANPSRAPVHTMSRALRGLVSVVALLLLPGFYSDAPGALTGKGEWKHWGGNLHNTHFADAETSLSPDNIATLKPKWVFDASGSVSAVPTVMGNDVYVTDWGAPLGSLGFPPGGRLYAINKDTGAVRWSHLIAEYGPHKLYNMSRSSPAVAGDRLIIGDMMDAPLAMIASVVGLGEGLGGTNLYAVHRWDGSLLWKTTLDDHPLSNVTQSPVVHNGKIYVGVSSKESAIAKFPYPCCTFRGSMMAVDLESGKILWKTYMVPDNHGKVGGYSGGAVWGSSPAIDEARGLVYITTGQNYDVPAVLKDCLLAHVGNANAQRTECLDKLEPADNRTVSVVALDLVTGAVRWSKKAIPFDLWNFACDPRIIPYIPAWERNCPEPTGGDLDFGQAPMLVTSRGSAGSRDLVVVGQKSGVFWALDPDQQGEVVWSTRVGPGGIQGGMEFGAATDGQRIYTQITNIEHAAISLSAGPQAGQSVRGGIWAALDVSTGAIVWQTPDPSSQRPLAGSIIHPIWGGGLGDGYFGVAMGPMTVANGLVFAGSMDREGHMYALSASTGQILWSFASGGSVMSAPSVVDGVLYWGSGYPVGFNNNKLYAFALSP